MPGHFAMLPQLNAHILNHLLSQNTWAAEQLRPFSGKVIRLSVPPLHTTLAIEGNGQFAPAAPDAAITAEIALSPGAAARVLFEPDTASSLATMQGDSELAAAVGKVLRGLRWDAEEDLSRIIGDIPAHELARAGSHISEELRRQAWSIAGMFAEYWLEEQPLVAKKRHLDGFSRDVDALREDVERLAKRLERLEKPS
jgi:ubiquinone biosynthesis accessory factor UbiJ